MVAGGASEYKMSIHSRENLTEPHTCALSPLIVEFPTITER